MILELEIRHKEKELELAKWEASESAAIPFKITGTMLYCDISFKLAPPTV